MGRLDGKIALVTGGSRGIGEAVCRAFAREGAKVVVNHHRPADTEFERTNAAEELVEDLTGNGGEAIAIEADVSQKASVDAMVKQVLDHFGGIDILVNNAGICPATPFFDISEELWDRVHSVNLKGAFLCSQAVGRVLVDQGRGGRIIGTSSISGLVGGETQAHYCPTKSGMHSLMQCLAIALGRHKVTCNSVMPGDIKTDIVKQDPDYEAKLPSLIKAIPVGRIGEPADVAGAYVYLASDEASYVNGASILVDGGWLVNLQ